MKHLRTGLVALAIGIGGLGAAAAASAPEVTLRFNRWVPLTHHFHTQIMEPWARRVEEASKGRIKIEFTPASLGAPPRQFDLARTGIVDIAAGNQTYTPERFVASRVAELPFLSNSAEALSVANWRVQQKYFSKINEYKGTKLLTVFNNGPTQIFTTNKVVDTVADLKNLKMRAAGGLPTEVADALDVVGVSAPITESYEMLSRGIVDGTFAAPDSVRSFRMDKFLNHEVKVPLGLYNASFFVVMNEARWNSLSKENQEAIMSVSGEDFARAAGRDWDNQDRMADEAFTKSGMKITTADDKMMAELHRRLDYLDAEWIKEASAKGVDGRAALAALRQEVVQYRKPN